MLLVRVERKIRNQYREAEALKVIWHRTNRNRIASFGWVVLIMLGVGVLATTSSGQSSFWSLYTANLSLAERHLDSVLAFPLVRESSDEEDILRTYPAYLAFVVTVGRDVDAPTTKKLVNTYENLKRRSPSGAARFLKGLRFEMVQKVELMGIPPRRLTTKSSQLRPWVNKYLKEWAREADEQLFRSIATPRVE
jgi:hypothetical protein